MLLGMIPGMPRILEDAKKWLSKAKKNICLNSTIADKKIAIGSYNP